MKFGPVVQEEMLFKEKVSGRGMHAGQRPITIPHLEPSPGRVAQSVTCLATDACLTADPGVASSIPARSHTFMEIDYGHSPPFR